MAANYSETEAIVLCPHCEGSGAVIWPQSFHNKERQVCATCSGNGRVVQIKTIKYEKLPSQVEPTVKWIKGI